MIEPSPLLPKTSSRPAPCEAASTPVEPESDGVLTETHPLQLEPLKVS